MSGDYTRNTFRPGRHFTGVRQQQGRVLLDADWNEEIDIRHHLQRTALIDGIGRAGVPADDPGFGLIAVSSGDVSDLVVGAGRAYVDGLLVENHEQAPTTLTRESGAGDDAVWIVAGGPRLAASGWVRLKDAAPEEALFVSETSPSEEDSRQRVQLSTDPGGDTQTVSGLASYEGQAGNDAAANEPGPHLAYLDVWEREITAVDDESLKDVALGGVDTTLRTQVTWRVSVLALQPLIDAGDLESPVTCHSFKGDWSPHGSGAPVRMAARTNPVEAAPDPCALPSQGGYRSLDNRLYRVEVHVHRGDGIVATYIKWSRDNGIHRTRLLAVEDGSLQVESVGRDSTVAYRPGQWIEIQDERRILNGEPGFFVEIGEVVGTRLGVATVLDCVTLEPVTQNGNPNTDVLPAEGFVRRWEGGRPIEAAPDTWCPLENGIEVKLAPGVTKTGDHWLIPARTTTAAIEWPADEATGNAAFVPPHGVAHHFLVLAIVERADDGMWSVTEDCRDVFSPLTELESFFYRGGDGQEVATDLREDGDELTPLADPLIVGVARGETPVPGRAVRFRVVDADPHGRLSPGPETDPGDVITDAGDLLIVKTGADGLARASLSLHRQRHVNRVAAELLAHDGDEHAGTEHLPVRFTARTSIANEVAYDPYACAYQQSDAVAPGTSATVQEALDKLCPRVELQMLGGDGQALTVDADAPLPLSVGVFWGKQPLRDITVTFELMQGDATVTPSVITDERGVASATLHGGNDPLANAGLITVVAKAEGTEVPAVPGDLTFTARFLNAKHVYVDPDVCPDGQEAAGSNTVAALLQYLCGDRGLDRAVHVTGIFRPDGAGELAEMRYGDTLRAEDLTRGVSFEFDAEIARNAIEPSARTNIAPRVGEVELDLIFPEATLQADWWRTAGENEPLFATRTTRVNGSFVLGPDRRNNAQQMLRWMPSESAQEWLRTGLPEVMRRHDISLVEARLVLHGHRIWSTGEPRYLDGELFPDAVEPSKPRYPSGAGRAGGALCLPFFVLPSAVFERNSLVLVTIPAAPFFEPLSANALNGLSAAVDTSIDRPTLHASSLVPADISFDARRSPDVARARALVDQAGIGARELRVLVPLKYEALFDALAENWRAIGLDVRAVPVDSDAEAILSRIKRQRPGIDAILADALTMDRLTKDADAADKLGEWIVTL